MKNLLSVDEVGLVGTRYYQLYTVSPCLSAAEGCGIYPTVLGETADRGGRRDDAIFAFVSMEGKTTHAKLLMIMDACSFPFVGRSDMSNTYKRKTNRASWTQEYLESVGEAFIGERKTVVASRSLVTIDEAILFTSYLSCLLFLHLFTLI
jgi:hypothetical protein